MGDRYRYASGRRSPTSNPARASLPAMSTGYSSFHGGDIHVIPTSRYESSAAHSGHHSHHRQNSSTSDWRGPNVPVTTTHYTVRKDPVPRTAAVREHSRHRSATLDGSSKRPPIIVTTRQTKETSSTAHNPSGRDVPASPAPDRGRGGYRSSNNDETPYYTIPASSMRSRSHTRPHQSGSLSSTLDNEEFLRLRQRTDDRLAPSWNEQRRERPTSMYANAARHNTATVELGESGYEYTTPSALARYDLENDRRPNRDIYYRPSVNISDINRQYDGRSRGPPPTTRGLDKINRRAAEESGRMPVPAVVPVPVPERRNSQHDIQSIQSIPVPAEPRHARSGHRPVSLYQDGPPRASYPDDIYRSRDDDFVPKDREPRDRDYYRDENVGSRGFGLRVDGDKKGDHGRDDAPPPRTVRESRRDSRIDDRDREPRRHSDEDVDRYDRRYARDHGGRKDDDVRMEKKSSREDKDRDDDRDKTKLRDKVATGLSLAAGAVLGGALGHKDKDDKEERESPKRRTDDEMRRDVGEERPKPPRREQEERTRDDADDAVPVERSRRDRDREAENAQDKERSRRDAEARLNGDVPGKDASSSSDESKPRRRRRPSNAAFKPNDTASLMALKEQLKAKEESDKENKKGGSKEQSPERRAQPSPSREDRAEGGARSSRDDLRGRRAESPSGEDRQVRVVSPPKDKDDKKPIKGILKQPKPQFPEEPNPVREGVAPHKDDKTKSNVPPGARWTKISRKLVNPEALSIGKERFEVRDDFVIVLRVLNKDEIEAYTAATAQLREMRRKEYEKEHERDRDDDRDYDEDDRRRHHRSHRRDTRDEEDEEKRRRDEKRDKDRDRDGRSRRHRHEKEEEEEPRRIEYVQDDERDRFPYRSSHRQREREREREPVSVRDD